MALKQLLDLNKTDRYTADGRDELVKLQKEITEDVTYKPGDISQKTGLQKQPDGSWAPPKGGKSPKKEGLTNAEGKLSERAKFAYQEHAKKISNESLESLIRNKNKAFEKHNDEIAEIFKEELSRRNKKDASGADVINNENYKNDVRTEAGEKKILSETNTEVLQSKIKDLEEQKKKNGGKLGTYGEKSLQLAKEELAKRQSSGLMEKYKGLPGAQKKDALYASTFEGSSIGMTQKSMESQGWELISTGEETGENVNVYAKPDGSKVTMKHDGKTITSSEYEAPGSADAAPKIRELTGDTKIRIRK